MGYYQQRMALMGVTPEKNLRQVRLWDYDSSEASDKWIAAPIFEQDGDDIIIHTHRLDGSPIAFDHPDANPEKNLAVNARTQFFKITRLANPVGNKKYDIPRKGGVWPFFGNNLRAKFTAREKIHTLWITEGYLKAWVADDRGIDCVGLTSIHHLLQNGVLFEDITRLILACDVSRIVLLHDADARQLKPEDIEAGKDLYSRLNLFYSAAMAFADAIKTVANKVDASVYYATIKPGTVATWAHTAQRLTDRPAKWVQEDLELAAAAEERQKEAAAGRDPEFPTKLVFQFAHGLRFMSDPKGLDDLLIAHTGNEAEILKEMETWNPLESKHFVRLNITHKAGKLRAFFNIQSANFFHAFYQNQLGGREFLFNGTNYKWNADTQTLDTIVPAEAKLYARVGVDYYKTVSVPNKYGILQHSLRGWSKATIVEDHGKDFIQMVPKFEAFCIVPEHFNYQKVISNCYNLYHEIDWEPEEGDIHTSLYYVKHIFGSEPIYHNGKTFPAYELGLDYLQLLYMRPAQPLPVLSLVSTERDTGKTTFGNWLSAIFKSNATFVSNDDWFNAFNGTWADKLVIITEEALLEKRTLLEKVKALSTGETIQVNRKGKDQVQQDFFGKFIFNSNNENDFILIDEEETRFWVRKIQSIPQERRDPRFKERLFAEIPAFLYYLSQRDMTTKNESRQWFHYDLTRTEALRKLKNHSRSKVVKLVTAGLKEWFLDHEDITEFMLTTKKVIELFLKGNTNADEEYVTRELKEKLKLRLYTNADGRQVTHRYRYPVKVIENGITGVRWHTDLGRPWVFPRRAFVSPEEEEQGATTAAERDRLQAQAAAEIRELNLQQSAGADTDPETVPELSTIPLPVQTTAPF